MADNMTVLKLLFNNAKLFDKFPDWFLNVKAYNSQFRLETLLRCLKWRQAQLFPNPQSLMHFFKIFNAHIYFFLQSWSSQDITKILQTLCHKSLRACGLWIQKFYYFFCILTEVWNLKYPNTRPDTLHQNILFRVRLNYEKFRHLAEIKFFASWYGPDELYLLAALHLHSTDSPFSSQFYIRFLLGCPAHNSTRMMRFWIMILSSSCLFSSVEFYFKHQSTTACLEETLYSGG